MKDTSPSSYNERQIESIMRIAWARGYLPPQVSEVNHLMKFWRVLSEEQKSKLIELCLPYYEAHIEEFKKAEEIGSEERPRRWLTVALPMIITVHSLFYVPEWWYSILIFIGAVIVTRLFLVVWDFFKGRYR